jgi:hypothetical protein
MNRLYPYLTVVVVLLAGYETFLLHGAMELNSTLTSTVNDYYQTIQEDNAIIEKCHHGK